MSTFGLIAAICCAGAWLGYVDDVGSTDLPSGKLLRHWRGERDGWVYWLYVTEPAAQHEPDVDAQARLAAALLSPDEEM